jgi:tetratricopeptide (TPR) repeat protein
MRSVSTTSWVTSGLALAALGVLSPTLPARQPTGPEVKQRIIDTVYPALRDNPRLRGAWASFDEIGGVWRFRLAVDQDRADAQLQELDRLLASTLAPGSYRVEEVTRLPVSRLVAVVQDLADEDPVLKGTLLSGAYFTLSRTDDDKPNVERTERRYLWLYGRVPPSTIMVNKEARVRRLRAICERERDSWHVWADLKQTASLQVRVDVTEVDPSVYAGHLDFRQGVAHFNAGAYGAAARDFSEALIEDPNNVTYLYWRALSEIGAGNTERAYRLLKPIVQVRRSSYLGPHDLTTLLPFERVQGPIRSTLHELERRALVEPVGPSGAAQ